MSGDLARKDVTPYPKREQLARPEKKPRRLKAGLTRWAEIREKKLGTCRVCQFVIENIPEARHMGLDVMAFKSTLHHLVGKDFGGSDTESNLVPLCGDGVKGHHGLVQRLDRAACAAVRRTLTDDEYSYVAEKAGEGYLERYYPVAYEPSGRASQPSPNPQKMKSLGSAIDPRASATCLNERRTDGRPA